VIQAADSSLFVLDRAFQKIAVFRPSGAFDRVILGGRGEGPGEFRLPVAMTMLANGRLAVLDYDLARVNLYDSRAGHEGTLRVDLPAPLRLVAIGGNLWVLRAL
jgi:hypothetical protein